MAMSDIEWLIRSYGRFPMRMELFPDRRQQLAWTGDSDRGCLLFGIASWIFGTWGSGKSSMLALLEEEINILNHEGFLFIKFNPWAHRKEPNILVPLLHAIHDATKGRFGDAKESAKKIFNVLTRLGADLLLKSITVNAVDLDKLEKLEKSYVDSRQIVESEMRKLRQTLEAWAKEIHGSD